MRPNIKPALVQRFAFAGFILKSGVMRNDMMFSGETICDCQCDYSED